MKPPIIASVILRLHLPVMLAVAFATPNVAGQHPGGQVAPADTTFGEPLAEAWPRDRTDAELRQIRERLTQLERRNAELARDNEELQSLINRTVVRLPSPDAGAGSVETVETLPRSILADYAEPDPVLPPVGPLAESMQRVQSQIDELG